MFVDFHEYLCSSEELWKGETFNVNSRCFVSNISPELPYKVGAVPALISSEFLDALFNTTIVARSLVQHRLHLIVVFFIQTFYDAILGSVQLIKTAANSVLNISCNLLAPW